LTMARNRKKVSLYEVISKSSPKSGYGKTLKERPPEESDSEEPTTAQTAIPDTGRTAYWPKKPKIIQLNAGRIEISLPYQLAIALLLGLVLLVLIGVWLGQTGYLSKQRITGSVAKILKPNAETDIGNRVDVDGKISPGGVRETTTGESKGNNRIVIQTYHARADLEPVQTYFGQCGIETEIIPIDNKWILVTKAKYEEKPESPGTDGYVALQNIIELGAKYKAPPGYEPFGAKSFGTAFGMKFDD